MITPTQYKAVIATLLALTLPGCGFQLPWASPSATSMNPSSAFEERALSPRDERVAALNHFPLDAYDTSITGSLLGDEATQDKRAKKQASCDRRQAVSVGMTREQLDTSCWGKPTSISTSTIGANKFELLVYQGYDYVYLEDDVVKSVQVSNR
jgi:hypothetical protein